LVSGFGQGILGFMTLVFASSNPHKFEEIRELLAPFGIGVRSASEMAATLPSPVEDADTFEGNARLKATAFAAALGVPCLADDSGLEVVALGGAPGLLSARYAGTGANRAERDAANRHKLLSELAALGQVDRSARLVCALCLTDAAGHVLFSTRGTATAVIAHEPRGTLGFGYDSLLLLPELGRTVAELSGAEWNARSHRAAAVRALATFLAVSP
jgi:XTP/dITP diphosphohydrolase